jgi:hypothetical protein
LDPREIEAAYKAGVEEIIRRHGGDATSAYRDPEWRLVSERARARYVLLANPGVDPSRALAAYAVDRRVVAEITGHEPEMPSRRRKDAYKAAIADWAASNVGAVVTAAQLAEVGETTASTARAYTVERPDLFWPAKKKGAYEVRDPKADRESEKEETRR